MPSCNKFFSHTAKLPHRTDLRGKSLSSCSRSCRAASRRMGRCRPKAVKGCKASLAQKRAVEKGGEHRGGTKLTFHAPLPPKYAVWRLGPARFAGPDVPSGPAERLLACRSLFVVAICAIVGQSNWPLFAPALRRPFSPNGARQERLPGASLHDAARGPCQERVGVGFLAMSQRPYGRRAAGDGPGCVSRLHQCFRPVARMLPGALSRRGQPASGNAAAGLRGSTTGLAALAWGKAASGWLQAAKAAWGQKLTWNI